MAKSAGENSRQQAGPQGPQSNADSNESSVGNRNHRVPGPVFNAARDRFQFEGISAGRNQGERNGSAAGFFTVIFGLQPEAKARIVNLRLLAPEIRSQTAFDAQVVELQFDPFEAAGKIAANVRVADMESGNFTADT